LGAPCSRALCWIVIEVRTTNARERQEAPLQTTIEIDRAAALRQLRSAVRGDVIAPADGTYDAARALYFTGFDHRPVAVAKPVDAADVARVIGVAGDSGLPLSVRSGGHSMAGHGVADGGILLDLGALRSLDIDVAARRAWAGAGLSAGEYTRMAGEHGVATGFGDSAGVGIGGITLSGGVGFLHRRYGLTIDNVVAAEVVTADGSVLHADTISHPDLFWAIRGGGGNFGVVTRFEYRLCDVGNVYGGLLVLPATAALMATFIAEAEASPAELCGMINVTIAPPLPFLPAGVHGKPIIMAAMVYAGDAASGERAFAPFRALATPYVDDVAELPYPAMFEGPPAPHPARVAIRSFFTDGVSLDHAEATLEYLQRSTAPMRVAQFRVLGGAVAEVPAEATAFPHRARRIMANVAAMAYDTQHLPEYDAWATEFAAKLRNGAPGAYVAFLCDEGEARVREAYLGSTWDRLRAIKRAYDPENLFRLNQNVPPA
jgi:FAD/FMN-containing dehydrogenase